MQITDETAAKLIGAPKLTRQNDTQRTYRLKIEFSDGSEKSQRDVMVITPNATIRPIGVRVAKSGKRYFLEYSFEYTAKRTHSAKGIIPVEKPPSGVVKSERVNAPVELTERPRGQK